MVRLQRLQLQERVVYILAGEHAADRPPLPSLLLANVQSLENKLDDGVRIRYQRDIRDCNIFCLMETWLTPLVPD